MSERPASLSRPESSAGARPAPADRRVVSQATYVRRRLVVGALVGLVIVGLIAGVQALFSSSDGGSVESAGTVADPADANAATGSGTGEAAPVAAGASGAAVEAEPVGDTSAGTESVDGVGATDDTMAEVETTPAPTEPPQERTGPPSASSPARVLIVGDSDAGTFGPYLEQLLDGLGIVETTLDYKVSSGLARPDFFNWQTEIREKVPAVDPDIVVVTFGGNDAQGLAAPTGEFVVGEPRQDSDNAEWRDEYGRRVGEVLDYLLEDDRQVIWVGIPNDDNPDVTFRMQVQDETAKAAVAERPGVVFIDTWKRFSGRSGGWAEYVVDPRDGQGKDVRADDGFHLNTTGAEILAIDIAAAVQNALIELGAQL